MYVAFFLPHIMYTSVYSCPWLLCFYCTVDLCVSLFCLWMYLHVYVSTACIVNLYTDCVYKHGLMFIPTFMYRFLYGCTDVYTYVYVYIPGVCRYIWMDVAVCITSWSTLSALTSI